LAEHPAITDLFSQFGDSAKTKLLILGSLGASSESLMSRLRSLNIEHVSPAELMQQEISRRTPIGQQAERAVRSGQSLPDESLFALLRKWFWSRKPDAGFALTGFPATLLQAKVFDEWLEARDEALDGVVVGEGFANHPVHEHYRTYGLQSWALIS
jgi:adenylate kinase